MELVTPRDSMSAAECGPPSARPVEWKLRPTAEELPAQRGAVGFRIKATAGAVGPAGPITAQSDGRRVAGMAWSPSPFRTRSPPAPSVPPAPTTAQLDGRQVAGMASPSASGSRWSWSRGTTAGPAFRSSRAADCYPARSTGMRNQAHQRGDGGQVRDGRRPRPGCTSSPAIRCFDS